MIDSQKDKLMLSEEDAKEIEDVYNGLLGRIKQFLSNTDTEDFEESISNLIDFIIEVLSAENNSLLLYISKIFDKDYNFAHSLNVCLISIRIGMRLDFGLDYLRLLGFLGLTHIKKDIKTPVKLLNGIAEDKQKEIEEIIALADIYDAINHPPTYRHIMLPFETLTAIINSNKFGRSLIKILLEEVGFYPKGSWVQLSTHEIGKVIEVNKNLPLRPLVWIIVDKAGQYAKDAKTVDLSKNMLLYVIRPLLEREINDIKNK